MTNSAAVFEENAVLKASYFGCSSNSSKKSAKHTVSYGLISDGTPPSWTHKHNHHIGGLGSNTRDLSHISPIMKFVSSFDSTVIPLASDVAFNIKGEVGS